jgi:hypothetical protein
MQWQGFKFRVEQMENEDIVDELKKLKFHIKMLSDAAIVTEGMGDLASLVVSFDWSERELNTAHDIFESYEKKLNNAEAANWRTFEKEFSEKLDINYQGLKSVVIAFYRNHQWVNVCAAYANYFEPTTPVEFHFITRREAN